MEGNNDQTAQNYANEVTNLEFESNEGIKYNLMLEVKGMELQITLNKAGEIGFAPYSGNVTLENLGKMNKYFKMLDSVSDVIEVIKKGIEAKKGKVIISGNKF